MQTFHETLWELKNDELSLRLRLLDVKLKRINKGTLVDSIKAAYAGEGLRRIWESLSTLQQAAVAEAVWDQDHRYNKQKIAAKYGENPRAGQGCCIPPGMVDVAYVHPAGV